MNLNKKAGRDKTPAGNEEPASTSAPYPSARYFQVHFEHIEGMIGELLQALAVLREEIAELRQNAARQSLILPPESGDTQEPLCPLKQSVCQRERYPEA